MASTVLIAIVCAAAVWSITNIFHTVRTGTNTINVQQEQRTTSKRRQIVNADTQLFRKTNRTRIAELSRPLDTLCAHLISHGQVETNSLRFAQYLYNTLRSQQPHSLCKLTSSRQYYTPAAPQRSLNSPPKFFRVTHLAPLRDALDVVNLCRDVQSIVLDYLI
jgi:hypothetical protein